MLQVTMGFAVDAGERSGAWDEVYYLSGDDVNDGITRMTDTAGIIALQRTSCMGRRLACLAEDCYLYYMRVARVGFRGQSRVMHQRISGYRGESNYAGDAANMRANNEANTIHREIRLGGLPDSWVENNTLSEAAVKNYVWTKLGGKGTFINKLISIGGEIRFRNTTLGGPSSYSIRGVTKDGQYGLLTVTTNRTSFFDPTVAVDISVRGQPQFRGRWKVASSPSVGVLVLAGSERFSVPASVQGFVTLVVMEGGAIANVDQPYVSEHKLGKKKYQRRGRSSPKLIRH